MSNNYVKPSILPGFMELLPAEQILFNKMMDTIRGVYEAHGFVPLDTPVIEKEEILLAKAGGETEKQIYRFEKGKNNLALRFDLTVPLARYVAQYYNELSFPFRRYQISKVFRGEKAQRGRFREFYQCDIDIIGNEKLSVINDAEILSVIYTLFTSLNFEDFTIRINNRKVLQGFLEGIKVERKPEVLRAIDKLEKIGIEAVIKELEALGLEKRAVDRLVDFISQKGTPRDIIDYLGGLDLKNDLFQQGIAELTQVLGAIEAFQVPERNYQIDLTIVRGLDYYTGTVYETILNQYPEIGSVCSGGRYESLAENYTDKKLPGVGISIGLTRLFYQLREANIIQPATATLTEVLVVPMDEGSMKYGLKVTNGLRKAGIITEIYLEDGKFKKKLNYANKQGIPYVIIIGEDETEKNRVSLKEMSSGEQKSLSLEEAIGLIESQNKE
ncbi:histidine--tRNA ligase [Alkaliphilus crotonatoxidans]